MICELFPFQKQAVNEMRLRVAMALNNYRMLKIPQVVSLQAPTGSGKTIIMSALIEDIFYGSEQFTEQPEAIFVWLSDSPQLNEQSKQKIELKADKIRMDQCVVISDESFDREILEDGHIYFLNTQKLGKAGNLSRHSDTRQYTIWETIENTAREKADRLYFIIDEAHRGMQGRQAGTATTIMQRFIKGSSEQNLLPIPVVIGMSATAERFNSLVGQATNSTLHKVIISPAQVRQSGLLKDRIVITYPEDPIKHGDMAVLQAATDEWQDKCKHWYQYTYEQHYTNVNPVFVIQVCAGSGTKVSDTDLDDVIAKIEERMGDSFKENEVVHTFGSTGTLSIHGLTVPHIEPSEIAEDRRIRVVLFKENLSTGWDCPRAETMMSFRRAEDATYIAQLLGRMVRTPLQCHVLVDDSLNDVRLFLPYFNQDTVQKVIDELQATEGGEIPTVVDGESLEEQNYDTWSVHNQRKKTQKLTVGQLSIFDYPNGFQEEPAVAPSTAVGDMPNSGVVAVNQGRVDVKWDFLIIDEAHNLRNVFHGTKRAKNLYDLTHGIPKILLTATPLQNSLTDLHGLVSFIDPRIFGSEKVFNRRFVDGCDYEELKQELLPVLYRTLRRDVGKYMAFSKRTCITVDFHLSAEEKELYDVTNDFLRRDPLYSIPNANRGLIILVIRKLLASSSFALIETFEVLEKRLEKLYEGTKSAYAQEGFDLFWGFVEDEIDEDGFNEYDDEETAEKKQAIQAELKIVRHILEMARAIKTNAKIAALREALKSAFDHQISEGLNQKAVVFTESKRTQKYIAAELRRSGYSEEDILLFNGDFDDAMTKEIFRTWKVKNFGKTNYGRSVEYKHAIVDYFKSHAKILIVTDAGSEGLNLQFCNTIIKGCRNKHFVDLQQLQASLEKQWGVF